MSKRDEFAKEMVAKSQAIYSRSYFELCCALEDKDKQIAELKQQLANSVLKSEIEALIIERRVLADDFDYCSGMGGMQRANPISGSIRTLKEVLLLANKEG